MKKSIQEVIIVEGRYDKNTVSSVVDATIIETSGFGILNDKEKVALLQRLAEKRGLIILTDSDKAGFFIRGRLKGILGDANIKHAYIPDIKGKEKRKETASREGKLGVEGMTKETILKSLIHAGATFLDDNDAMPEKAAVITKTDLFDLGLSGRDNSTLMRQRLLKQLNLPERLTANGLLEVLNILYTRDDFFEFIRK